jgi:hypothetical protein
MTPLHATPLGSPINEPLHLRAILPAEAKEFAGVHPGGFRAKKGLEAPTEVRAVPRFETVTASYNPIILYGLKHRLQTGHSVAPAPLASFF